MAAIRSTDAFKEIGTLSGYFQHHLLSVALPITDAGGNFKAARSSSQRPPARLRRFSKILCGVC